MRGRPKEHARPETGFVWLRLFGALLVVFDHSTVLASTTDPTIFPGEWNIPLAHIAVLTFFAMSGYQVSGSWARDPSWWRFSFRRILRIFPPYVFVLMVCAFVVGPLFTTLSSGDYWRNTRVFCYVVCNTAMFPMQHDLPGVFTGNPYPWAVNGSIWTLPMELLAYGTVVLVGILGLVRHRLVLLPLLVGIVALDIYYGASAFDSGRPGSIVNVPIGTTVNLLVPFVIGMILFAYRDRIPLSPWFALLLLAVWLAVHWTPADRYVFPVAMGYGVITLAHHMSRWFEHGKKWAYGSYGAYLWGFVIQQMVVAVFGVSNKWVLIAVAVPLSWFAGLLSWLYIEKPTQELRAFIRRPERVVVEPPAPAVRQPVAP